MIFLLGGKRGRHFSLPSVFFLGLFLFGVYVSAETVTFDGRTSNLNVPASYASGTPAPLIVLLHGYGSNGISADLYFRLSNISEEFGFFLLNPDGLVDGNNPGWNATDACCDFNPPAHDDSSFLRGLIEAVINQYNIDPRMIFITGHSNGGFMSYRMACDHADIVAAIASLAGATFNDPESCNPSEPVHVLQIHGTNDSIINYAGGVIGAVTYPSAIGSVERWNAYNNCTNSQDASVPLRDIDDRVVGDETSTIRFTDGCALGGSGELWTIVSGTHVPKIWLDDDYARNLVEYFFSHTKPETFSVPALSFMPTSFLGLMFFLATIYYRRRPFKKDPFNGEGGKCPPFP